MSKREAILLGGLGLILIPVALMYVDFGGNAEEENSQREELVDPMVEVMSINSLIPPGARNVEDVTLTNWGRDVFTTAESIELAKAREIRDDSQFTLSGIMTSGLVRSAVINEQVVTKGSRINRYTVDSILENMVILRWNTKKIVLSIDQ